jgi:hypothetical protein
MMNTVVPPSPSHKEEEQVIQLPPVIPLSFEDSMNHNAQHKVGLQPRKQRLHKSHPSAVATLPLIETKRESIPLFASQIVNIYSSDTTSFSFETPTRSSFLKPTPTPTKTPMLPNLKEFNVAPVHFSFPLLKPRVRRMTREGTAVNVIESAPTDEIDFAIPLDNFDVLMTPKTPIESRYG